MGGKTLSYYVDALVLENLVLTLDTEPLSITHIPITMLNHMYDQKEESSSLPEVDVDLLDLLFKRIFFREIYGKRSIGFTFTICMGDIKGGYYKLQVLNIFPPPTCQQRPPLEASTNRRRHPFMKIGKNILASYCN